MERRTGVSSFFFFRGQLAACVHLGELAGFVSPGEKNASAMNPYEKLVNFRDNKDHRKQQRWSFS